MSEDCPYCKGSGKVTTSREARNAEWATMRAAGLSFSAIARQAGVDHKTVQYALDPAFAARRRDQMKFNYYLNNVLPRELDAEAAQ